MNSGEYFVRSKGKITGPFSLPELRAMANRQQIGRFHEISADRQNWSRADANSSLFSTPVAARTAAPARSTKIAPSFDPAPQLIDDVALVDLQAIADIERNAVAPRRASRAADAGPTVAPVPSLEPAPDAEATFACEEIPDTSKWFYVQRNGALDGPVSLETLTTMARQGQLHADDMLSGLHDPTCRRAGDLPALAHWFATAPALPARPSKRRRKARAAPGAYADVSPAGFWRRLGALLVDIIVILVGSFAILKVFFPGTSLGLAHPSNLSKIGMVSIVTNLSVICYYTIFHGMFGKTLGKMACGIRLAAADGSPVGIGAAAWRAIVYWAPGIIAPICLVASGATSRLPATYSLINLIVGIYFTLDFLFVLFDGNNRRALHDHFAGTLVVLG